MRPGQFADDILENLATAVLLFDRELRLVAMNSAAEALLDVSASKVCGFDVGRLFAGAEACSEAIRRVLATSQAFTERQLRLCLPGARRIMVDCTVTPMNDVDQPFAVLVELSDLDRHHRISREEQLVAQNETARALVRRLAHEIRNPLGGLRGAAQLLASELDDDGLREYTQVIIREADRLQKLTDGMLGPRTLPRMRDLNIHEIVERVYALVRAEAPAGVEVARDYDPSIPNLRADPELLIQATLNVARNAVQILDGQGGITFRTRVHRQFTIGSNRHRLVVRIDVADTGAGIPEELRETLFYPMVTGRDEGTGLGLSIAQSLVNQHNGIIECNSEPGNTTFSILLPIEDGQ